MCHEGEWLVDDMAPPTGKRRRTSSTCGVERLERRERRRGLYRPRLSAMTDDTVGVAGSPSPSSSAPPRNTPIKNTPPKGTPPKGTPTKDKTDLGSRNTPPTMGTQVLAPPTDSILLRLRVSIENRVYLVPCPRKMADGCDTTVSWLASEAAERYRAHLGVRPTLTLTTSDGAHLSPGDALCDVLQSNEEVRGVVEHKELPPLSERYQMACRNDGMVCHCKSLQLFQLNDDIITTLDLSNIGLRTAHAVPLFHALCGLGTLASLNLSGNPLGDASLPHLASSVPHLPSLIHLDISCTGITDQGLVGLVGPSASSEVENIWRSLQRLTLAYNGLGGGGARGVATLLRRCSSLQGLVLEGCGLAEGDCESRDLQNAFRVLRCLSELNVSRNSLESQGVGALMTWLDVGALRMLDVSATCSVSSVCGGLHLGASFTLIQALDLSHGCIGDDGVQDLVRLLEVCAHLQDLGLADNDLTQSSVGPLCGYLLSAVCLQSLDLSANFRLCNAACLQLLDAVLSSNLVRLNMSYCGMASPLPLAGMEKPRLPLRMEKLDLSGNDLEPADCSFICLWLGGFSPIHHNSIILSVK